MNNSTENDATLEELQNWTLNKLKKLPSFEENLKLDLIDFTVILQSVGFKLDKVEHKENHPNDDTIRVDLVCSKSGLSTSLSMCSQVCEHPNDITINKDEDCSSSQVSVSASSNIAFPQLSEARQKFIQFLMGVILSVVKKDDTKEEFKSFEYEENAKWLLLPTRASSPQPNFSDAVKKVKRETNTIIENVLEQIADLRKVIDSNLSIANGYTFVENGRRISDIGSNPNPLVINVSPPKSGKTSRMIRKITSPKIKSLKKKWDSSTAKVGSFRQNSTPNLQRKSENKRSTPQSKQNSASCFQEKTNPDTPIPSISTFKKPAQAGAIPKKQANPLKSLTRT